MTTDNNYTGVTPVGRIISEAIFIPTDKGYQGRQLDTPIYYIQLAIPKTDPGLKKLFEDMTNAAHGWYSNNEPAHPDFAWKYKDGDDPKNSARDGWTGCFIFSFRTGFTPTAIVDLEYNQILDRNKIKPGYQARVSYSIKANGDKVNPGIYLNFYMVQLVSVDKEIQIGLPPTEVFSTPVQANPMQPGAIPVQPMYPAPPTQVTHPAPPAQYAQVTHPAPPTQVTHPAPPTQVTHPAPPTQVTHPAPPTQVTHPAPPTQVTHPAPPTQVTHPAPPTQVTHPAPPTQVTHPAPPTQYAQPAPPTQYAQPAPPTQQPYSGVQPDYPFLNPDQKDIPY